MSAQPPLLLPVEDAAALLTVPAGTVRTLIGRGELRAIRLPGGRLRVAREDLETFVRGQRDRGTGAADDARPGRREGAP